VSAQIGIGILTQGRSNMIHRNLSSCYSILLVPPTFPLAMGTPHLSNPSSFVLQVHLCKEQQICPRVRVPLCSTSGIPTCRPVFHEHGAGFRVSISCILNVMGSSHTIATLVYNIVVFRPKMPVHLSQPPFQTSIADFHVSGR
jgi:hypothetical protein